MPKSYNGWYASPDLKTRVIEPVEGCRLRLVDNDDVCEVFNYLVKQFHIRVDDVTKPHPMDDWSFYFKRNTNDPNTLSCHASGTAIDLDATEHPNGVATSRTFTPKQIAEVHEILRELDGVIRWGGDYTRTADAMHFEIIKSARAVKKVANKLRKGKIRSQIEIISYNVQIGRWQDDLMEVRRIAREEKPDVIALYEATNLFGHLAVPGYTAYQLKPVRRKKGSQPNTAGVALLIRNGLRKDSVANIVMKKFWKGPKHGLLQDPRVYKSVRIKKGPVTWKISAWHLPFGSEARAESNSAMVTWFRGTFPGRPAIAVTDYNGSKYRMEKDVADKVDANVIGSGVDLAAYKNCSLYKQQILQARFNDHPVMKWIFVKR